VKHGSPTKAVPGWDVRALADDGTEMPRGSVGTLAIPLPLPPGSLLTLWNADARFEEAYFRDLADHYTTLDAGYVDDDGYIFVMGRTDDVINVAGHRLSTGALEEVVAAHPDVAECAVIGPADPIKGQIPVGLVVLKAGATKAHAEIQREVIALVRERIGPVAAFKTCAIVKRLPKTRSGKILRGTLRKLADGLPHTVPATIDDPATLDEIRSVLADLGLVK